MTTTIPTEQEIRAMDGPSLTRLAWQLGLEPCDMIPDNNALWYVAQDEAHEWHPHDDLAQAAAVLRLMRLSGWQTVVYGSCDSGLVEIHDDTGQVWRERWGDAYDATPDAVTCEECEALLRCACLARAAQMREAIP